MGGLSRRDFLGLVGSGAAWAFLGGVSARAGPAGGSGPDPPRAALFRPTAGGCTLHLLPHRDAVRVRAGPDPHRLATVREIVSGSPAEILLEGASPEGHLYYQCQQLPPGEARWRAGPVRAVRPAAPPGRSFSVALIADSHVCRALGHPEIQRNVLKLLRHLAAHPPDLVVFLGDEACVQFLGDAPGWMCQRRADERWAHWRAAFAPLLAAVPSFLVLGNHEGEAGYHRTCRLGGGTVHYQRWGTIARKRHLLNPLPDTYPEGGEDERWQGDPGCPATGGGGEGNRSPLQNYYAWRWGDALFAVLDVQRYTCPGGAAPREVGQWTLGKAQLDWLERVLTGSRARWKFVLGHHLVGGSPWNLTCSRRDAGHVYGRGGARYARAGEQAALTDLMRRSGSRFFLYGHDHVFAHQQAEDIHFVCCGRPTFLSPEWWPNPGWREAYGDVAARSPRDFLAALGYTRLTVSPDRVLIEYVRTGTDWRGLENVAAAEGTVVYRHAVS